MRSWSDRTVRWLRIIHRDLGYIMVGISLVYGISGILLNHMGENDPAYKSTFHTVALPAGLDAGGLSAAWNGSEGLPALKIAIPVDEGHTRLMLDGGIGIYNLSDGTLEYELYRKRPLVYWVNKLHYNNVKGWSVMADIFAVSLIFFAVSGLFMVKGRKGFGGRGKWLLLGGLLIPVFYVIFS